MTDDALTDAAVSPPTDTCAKAVSDPATRLLLTEIAPPENAEAEIVPVAVTAETESVLALAVTPSITPAPALIKLVTCR